MLAELIDREGVALEPSALAGMPGPAILTGSPEGRKYVEERHLLSRLVRANHIVWATGGGMVPEPVKSGYYARGATYRY